MVYNCVELCLVILSAVKHDGFRILNLRVHLVHAIKRVIIMVKRFLPFFILLLFSNLSWSQLMTPEGHWRTVDDKTGKPKSIVLVWVEHDELKGKIEAVLDMNDEMSVVAKCTQCTGSLKDHLILGLPIMNGYHYKGGEWIDGTLLEPKTGKTYSSIVKLSEDGLRLEVTGYRGLPSFGRTQVWERVENFNSTR